MSAGTSDPDRGAVSPWHTLAAADVLAALKTSAEGLDAAEAARRLKLNGPNQLPAPPRPQPVLRFLARFNNMLIWFLLAAAAAIAAQLAFTFAPLMHSLLDSAPLTLGEGAISLGIGVVVMAVLETDKALMRRLGVLRRPDA